MKKVIVVFFITLLSTVSFADSMKGTIKTRPENNINLNIVGDASIISINYERLFIINKGFFITGKLGIGYNEEFTINLWGSSSSPEHYLVIPHHITGNVGKEKHFFEFGLGGTIINGNTNEHYLLYPLIGYRLQPINYNKVNFRIFVGIPVTGLETEDILFSPLGLSVGICF